MTNNSEKFHCFIRKGGIGMIKIAICDDDEKELAKATDGCLSYLAKHSEYRIKINKFKEASDLISHIKYKESFDILLLDIYMPNMTGIELAHIIRERKEECEIIFLTTSSAHAIEAFTLNASHYLLKPYTRKDFHIALSKALSQLEKRKKAQITLKSSTGIHKVLFKDFIYAETEGHIQKIFLEDNKCLSIRLTSVDLFEKISHDKRFYKCGSTYIINLEKVKELTYKNIFLDNGEEIRMQRRQYKTMIDRYTSYSLEGN